MPDHVHLMIEGCDERSDARLFMTRFKQTSTYRVRRTDRYLSWQRGYHDRVVRSHEAWSDIARYVVNNPIRAGLVDDPLDYAGSGAIGYEIQDIMDGLML